MKQAPVGDPATPNNMLRPVVGPWHFFRRVRCSYQGAICDDIDNYHRTHEMMHILTSKANRENDDAEGFGFRWDSDDFQIGAGNAEFASNGYPLFNSIGAQTSKTVSFKPLVGIFNQPKYLP